MFRNAARLCALILLFSLSAQAADLNDPVVRARLEKGEIVVELEKEPGTHVLDGTAMGTIEASRERVWDVLGDCNYFSEFIPVIRESFMLRPEVMEKIGDKQDLKKQEPVLRQYYLDSLTADTFLLYQHLDFPFPVGDRRCIVSRETDSANFRITYHLVRGDMKVDEGSWQLLPYGGKTLAIYTTRSDPGVALPAFLMKIGSRRILPDVIKGVRARAEATNGER